MAMSKLSMQAFKSTAEKVDRMKRKIKCLEGYIAQSNRAADLSSVLGDDGMRLLGDLFAEARGG